MSWLLPQFISHQPSHQHGHHMLSLPKRKEIRITQFFPSLSFIPVSTISPPRHFIRPRPLHNHRRPPPLTSCIALHNTARPQTATSKLRQNNTKRGDMHSTVRLLHSLLAAVNRRLHVQTACKNYPCHDNPPSTKLGLSQLITTTQPP